MEYENVKEKLSDIISNDHCGTYTNYKYEECYAIGKYVAIHGTAAALRKFKKLYSHYRLTESSVVPIITELSSHPNNEDNYFVEKR